MVELRKYFDKLQDKIGQTHSADEILEGPWYEVVVRELNQISFDCARELQLETLMVGMPMTYLMKNHRLLDC